MTPRRQSGRAPVTSPASATVFTTVLTQGPVSRVEVARRTGLSSAAVTKAARPLIEAGYLTELDSEQTGIGRPVSPLEVRADREFFLGIKITDSELIGVVTDLRAQILVTRFHRLPSRKPDAVVSGVAEMAAELLALSPKYTKRTNSLGVTVAGDVDREAGHVRYSPFLHWQDVQLAEPIGEATGLETTVDNDVKAITVAERWFGDGIGAPSFALVTLGTGIGCGLVVNGAVVTGSHGVAGEIGHIPVAGDGPLCHCGATGCVEAIASTDAIVAQARTATGERGLTMAEIVTRARTGDQALQRVFARAGVAIGRGLAAMANLVGPERIIVSGEGLDAYDLFADELRETFATHAFGAAAQCELILRPLPFEEWARGAAAVAVQTLFIS
ncbi:putative NBD/HSP70 family sugar kinase [Kibdelosporangium banguiense]|uniref:NBD/HSP70 family sugar kinase n=1 Tax=Kibdelosporangium banguiense TaxID=1365924 RepID=A0ABS4U2S1_9PSEU|nr:ROK family transcriptional regulator [Kibdelosporangium banguiense]MBP2330959.1 putative NBD/HSP70 family sugar kinase [Kibdelosporangium banguiense]